MSEAAIQAGVQTILRAMAEFADADVVINDYRILDQSTLEAPYAIIGTSDDFESRQDTREEVNRWSIPVTLVERFTDWATSLNNLRDRRQAIIDKFNALLGERAAGLSGSLTCDVIRGDGPIVPRYPPDLQPGHDQEAMPVFLSQDIILEFEEF